MILVRKHLWNLILVCFFCMVLVKQAPVWLNSYKQKNKSFPVVTVTDLKRNEITLPLKNQKAVYIFWATWCSPCHMQMDFFKKAVNKEELSGDQIIAINLGESFEEVKDFQIKNSYPFKIIVSKYSWKDFNVMVTPSISYVDEKGLIKGFTSGIAPLAVYKSKRFLKK